MAKIAKVTVTVEIDGAPVRGFPISRRLSLDETTSFSIDVASGGFTDLPVAAIGTKQLFFLQPAGTTTFQFGNGAAGNLQVNSGGFLLGVDCTHASDIEASPSSSTVIDAIIGGT